MRPVKNPVGAFDDFNALDKGVVEAARTSEERVINAIARRRAASVTAKRKVVILLIPGAGVAMMHAADEVEGFLDADGEGVFDQPLVDYNG